MSEKLVVPVDDAALNLLEEALEYHFVGQDENGDPIGSGEFDMYTLLDFWSGYDSALEIYEGPGITYYPHPVLSQKDVMKALIAEIRRLRA